MVAAALVILLTSFFIMILYRVDVGISFGLMDKLLRLNEKQCWNRPLSVTSSSWSVESCLFKTVLSFLSSCTDWAHSWTSIRFLARLFRTDSLFFSRRRLYSSRSSLNDVSTLFIDFWMMNELFGWNSENHSVFSFKLVLYLVVKYTND